MNQSFTFTVSSPLGAGNLQNLYLAFNTAAAGASACYIQYNPSSQYLSLADNSGQTFSGVLWSNTAGVTSNSQCTIAGNGANVTTSGNQIAVTVPVSFQSSFAGAQNVYVIGYDNQGLTTGWLPMGTWTVGSGTGPTISNLSPVTGTNETLVTINGTNFRATQGNSIITFNGTAATPSSWSATSIVAAVPTGATTGNVVVTVGGVTSNGATFTVLPTPAITTLSPTSGVVGTSVTITCSNFGSAQGNSTVMFNGTTAAASSWSATSVVAAVPAGATTGDVVVTVGGLDSNAASFTVTPTISGLSPTSGVAGTSVTITGTGFGSAQGTSTVTFSGVPATPSSWSATTIVASVPAAAATGNVVVTVCGVASSGAGFTVTPTITGLSPVSGAVGTPVTITGTGFGNTQGTSTVTFNGITAAPSGWGPTVIIAAVPSGATTGNVVVTVGGLASGAMGFTVVTTPRITSLFPASGAVGATVTIAGANFGNAQGSSTVTFGGTAATVSSWTATGIVAAVPTGATAGNVVVTVGGTASNGMNFTVAPTPAVTSVLPTSGVAGTSVTITGSGFGSAPGTVWLGSAPGVVTAWTSTQVVATVAANAVSGFAEVQQGGLTSNTVPFGVATATITSVNPNSNVMPGAQVMIAGTGFGASQGSGQVWLGTASGAVQSWSDTQVVATVAANSMSGNAQVLQGGVWSNGMPITVDALQIASINPTSGAPGAQVTFTGTGFGATQGSGVVWLGSLAANVVSWSDTQIVAAVAAGAVTGVARVQQNSAWSNAKAFVVPATNANSVMPAMLSMVVGDAHTIQALNSSGQSVTGLTWTSSNTSIVSLSADDPPILVAVAPGHVTITAGTGSADVMVFSPDPTTGDLPAGTVVWSNPGNGSGVYQIASAVPSVSGVADMFAFQFDGTVQAILSDGTTAWTAPVNPNTLTALPDFLGGLIVQGTDQESLWKLDGTTGAAYPSFSAGQAGLFGVVASPDGSVFALVGPQTVSDTFKVVNINPITGAANFSVPLPVPQTQTRPAQMPGGMIIAGDGYAYVAWVNSPPAGAPWTIMVTRVNSNGAYDHIQLVQWPPWSAEGPWSVGLITNADTGVVFTFGTPGSTAQTYMAVTNGATGSLVNAPQIAGQALGQAVQPVLQAQDGSFVGLAQVGQSYPLTPYIVDFDASGNVHWTVANDQPAIATGDGGIIGQSGVTYDQNGNATGQGASTIESWTLNAYQIGSVDQIWKKVLSIAQSWWPFKGGNASGSNSATQQPWYAALPSCSGATPCAREAALSALGALKTLLGTPCVACQVQVFQKLSGTSQPAFYNYLLMKPRLWDGTMSNAPLSVAACPSGFFNQRLCPFGTETVKAYMARTGSDAISQTPSDKGNGMQVFFSPSSAICNVLCVSNPPIGDKGVLNQAVLFHEALHGYTGDIDNTLESAFGLPVTIGESVSITYYIEGHVIPGGAFGANACH